MLNFRIAFATIGLLFALAALASADSYTRLLDVRCNPTVQVFSVRETGTWRFDGPFVDFIPVNRGASRTMNANETAATDGDLMARCDVGSAGAPVVFEVRRIGFLPPGQGLCRADHRAAFAITLNGAELTRWSDGYSECVRSNGDLPPAEGRSVAFDGDYVDICAGTSIQTSGRGRTLTIQCKSRPLEEALTNAR